MPTESPLITATCAAGPPAGAARCEARDDRGRIGTYASFFSFSNVSSGGSLLRTTPSVMRHSFTPSR